MAKKHHHKDYIIWNLPFFYWHKNASKEVLCLLRAILPVSNVSFARKNDSEGAPADKGMTAPLGKTVPVIVLMAMNPSLLNSAATPVENFDEIEPTRTEMVEARKDMTVDKAKTYQISPEIDEVEQSDAPFGWELFNYGKIVYNQSAKCNDVPYHLVFFTPNLLLKDDNPNYVAEVYLVNANKPGSKNILEHPPLILSLRYHKIGKENEYCGALVSETVLNEQNKGIGSVIRELALDDTTANLLYTYSKNLTDMENGSDLKMDITTEVELYPPEYHAWYK